ncbi:MAG: protein phosphatase 2C domain-containing protein [Acidimicrobiales bacterium]
MVVSEGAHCPGCGEVVPPEARFCEECGAELTVGAATTAAEPAAVVAGDGVVARSVAVPDGAVVLAIPSGTCGSCGGSEGYDPDGFCIACGMRSVRPRDRMEQELSLELELDLGGPGRMVAVSDKGPRKVRNEDSFALAALDPLEGDGVGGGGGLVLSVCDGVSNIPRSDEASQAACNAAVAVLKGTVQGSIEELQAQAAAAASAAVVALAPRGAPGAPAGVEPPSCTYLAARWHPAEGLSVGWLGDCRAYVVEAGQVSQLTIDHSWGTQAVASGTLTQPDADRDPRSHAITRWLGADAQQEPIPQLVTHQISGPALLVAVSDGAWNYLDHAQQVAEFFADGDLLGGARRFTQFAIDRGGHDNITVAAATLAPAASPPSDPTGTVPDTIS